GLSESYALSLHDALPISQEGGLAVGLEEVGEDAEGVEGDVAEDIVEDVRLGEVVHDLAGADQDRGGELTLGQAGEEGLGGEVARSEEHTSELQSRGHLVC